MKTSVFLSTCIATLLSFPLLADIQLNSQDVSDETINQPATSSPFSFDAEVDAVAPARITKKGFYHKDKIDFAVAKAEAAMVFYYDPEYTEGARAAIGYIPVYLKWHNNPWFEQDHFNTLAVSLTGFTKRAENWFWRAQVTANIDTDEWESKYATYDLIVWGRYSLCENIGVHLGFWGETGLQMDRVYPIIGFDWQITRKLKLSAVFPVDISLLYSISRRWSVGVAGRFFDVRFRVNHDQHSHKPLVRYTNSSAEFVVRYEVENMTANVHAGTTFGGKFRVADKHNNHAHDYDFGAAGYVGAQVDLKF